MEDVGFSRRLDRRDGVWCVEGIVCMDIIGAEDGDVSVAGKRQPDCFEFEVFRICQAEVGGGQ